ADATKPLAEVVDLDRLNAVVRVPRSEAVDLRAQQKAQLLPGGDASPIEAEVGFVSPDVDPATGTVLVRIGVPKGAGLQLGQFVMARILGEEHKDRLVVPAQGV